MSGKEDKQIELIISGAKMAPKKIAVFIDDYKEERFIKKLRAGLPESEFLIEAKGGLAPGTKTLFITRKVARDPSAN